jgi:hypothetical protein
VRYIGDGVVVVIVIVVVVVVDGIVVQLVDRAG